MTKIVESGYLRAEVDMTDINTPKITITTVRPVAVSEYRSNDDVWRWDREFEIDVRGLYALVNAEIYTERQRRKRECLCAAS